MTTLGTSTVEQSLRVLLADLGISPENVLLRASLPSDLLPGTSLRSRTPSTPALARPLPLASIDAYTSWFGVAPDAGVAPR